jgi:hypothetical protein
MTGIRRVIAKNSRVFAFIVYLHQKKFIFKSASIILFNYSKLIYQQIDNESTQIQPVAQLFLSLSLISIYCMAK